MKKLICMILTLVMSMGMICSAAASQVITFDETGKGTVSIEGNSSSSSTAANVKTDSSSSEGSKGMDSVLESVFGSSAGEKGSDNAKTSEKKGYLCLGQDLTVEQRATVLSLLGISEADLADYEIVYTSNSEEHAALDKYINPSLIGTRSLSSVLVKNAEQGHGVVVSTKNINYCTVNMYRNSLITAGVTDADIYVVAPTPISGTAALIGALKAYEKMSGKEVTSVALDTSLNELVTTGEISQAVGDDAQAEELISYIKTVVATNDLKSKQDIEAAIRKGMKDLNVTLSESEINQTVELMLKIKALGIDYEVLAEQADDIYAKYKDEIKSGTFDISKVDLKDESVQAIIKSAVTGSIKNIGNGIKSFFTGLFGK